MRNQGISRHDINQITASISSHSMWKYNVSIHPNAFSASHMWYELQARHGYPYHVWVLIYSLCLFINLHLLHAAILVWDVQGAILISWLIVWVLLSGKFHCCKLWVFLCADSAVQAIFIFGLMIDIWDYRQVSNIRCTKSQHLKDSRSVLQLSFPNPLKSDVKSRMKM